MKNSDYCFALLDRMFDNIFEIDFSLNTIKNIKSESDNMCCPSGPIRLILDDVLDTWINSDVFEDDRQELRDFFKAAENDEENGRLCIQFRLTGESGLNWYSGEIIKYEQEYMFCFNSISGQKSVALLEKSLEERNRHIEWTAKGVVACSRAGIFVVDYDLKNNRYWATQGYERYKFGEQPLGNIMCTADAIKYIHPDDSEICRQFFERIVSRKLEYTESSFRLLMIDGEYRWNYIGASMFYGSDGKLERILTAFRVIDEEKKKETALEYSKEFLDNLIDNTGNDIFTFRIENDKICIIYLTSKCSRYFGVTPSELHERLACGETVDSILRSVPLNNEQFRQLIKEGSRDFEMTDVYGKTELVTFRCKKLDKNYYVTLYTPENVISDRHYGPVNRLHEIKINTFGFFDMFVDGKPVLFSSEKAKELMALLVDRRGGYVSPREAISCLWEDELTDERTLAKYRKTAMKLKRTLEEYGIEYIVESINGKRRLKVSEVDCDLYDYLSGEQKHVNSFHGIYMTNYSWGETTLAGLGF